MMTQLQPPIPMETPKGRAWAVALIDYGPQWDLQWVTFLHDSGECWTFRNSQIRQEKNYTFGLPAPSPISRPSVAELGKQQPEGPQKEPRAPVRDPSAQKPQVREPNDKDMPFPKPTPSLSPRAHREQAVMEAMIEPVHGSYRNGHNGNGQNGHDRNGHSH